MVLVVVKRLTVKKCWLVHCFRCVVVVVNDERLHLFAFPIVKPGGVAVRVPAVGYVERVGRLQNRSKSINHKSVNSPSFEVKRKPIWYLPALPRTIFNFFLAYFGIGGW